LSDQLGLCLGDVAPGHIRGAFETFFRHGLSHYPRQEHDPGREVCPEPVTLLLAKMREPSCPIILPYRTQSRGARRGGEGGSADYPPCFTKTPIYGNPRRATT
jgi:hypothetical protein